MTARLYTFAIGLAAISGYFLWLALQLPGSEKVTTLIGPRTWPLGILIFLLGLIAMMLLLLVRKGAEYFTQDDDSEDVSALPSNAETVSPAKVAPDTSAPSPTATIHPWRHIAVLALVVAYTVAMEFTGYLVATPIFVAAASVVLGERKPLRILTTTIAAVVLVAVVFDRLLDIPLP